jgi:hypothetical protein
MKTFLPPAIKKLFVLLALLAPVLPALAQDKHIDAEIRPEGDGYKLVFLNSECPERPNENGCVMAARGTSPNISWELTGEGADQWTFTRLQFSGDGVHWGETGHPLPDCTMEDFDLAPADRESGNASTARVVANGKRLQILDRNINVCLTHYRLYAAPRAGGPEIDSDPVVDNRGRN